MNEAALAIIEQKSIELARLTARQSYEVQKGWLEVFAQNTKTKTGEYIKGDLMWHSFSLKHEECLQGIAALEKYKKQSRCKLFIFDHDLADCYFCIPKELPDFSGLGGDIYVSEINYKWTMVFTHEVGFGPYYAPYAPI